MATKNTFDAVAQSRKWRVATGKKLSAMTEEERVTHLNRGIAEKLESLTGKEPRKRTKCSRDRKQSIAAG